MEENSLASVDCGSIDNVLRALKEMNAGELPRVSNASLELIAASNMNSNEA